MTDPKLGAVAHVRYLRKTDFGRADGWLVELDGRVVGELFDPAFVDMFWVSYAVRPLARGAPYLHDDDLWSACRFAFRSRGTGRRVSGAFAGGRPPLVRDGRVSIRGLYLTPRSSFEHALLCVLPHPPRAQRG